MEFFIRIKDGQPFEHPIIVDNFRESFPSVDTNNLPAEFARFMRVQDPVVGVYEDYIGVTYELIDGVYKDVHHVVPMTEQQKIDKQNAVKSRWPKPYASWVFDENTCMWNAPVAYPTDVGTPEAPKMYTWNEESRTWDLVS